MKSINQTASAGNGAQLDDIQEIKPLEYDPEVTITTFKDRRNPNGEPQRVKWSEMLRKMAEPKRTAETAAEYAEWKRIHADASEPKEDRDAAKAKIDAAKDCGGFVGGHFENNYRLDRNITSRDIITIDLDSGIIDPEDIADIGIKQAWALYTTHTSTPAAPRFRLMFPLDGDIPAAKYDGASRKLCHDLAEKLQKDPAELFSDDSTHQPGRLMFWPSAPKDGYFIFRYHDGPAMSARKCIAAAEHWKPEEDSEDEILARMARHAAGYARPDPEDVTEGSRTRTLIGYIGHLVGSSGFNAEEIKQLVRDYNDKIPAPLTDRELQAEVFPAIERYRRNKPEYTGPAAQPETVRKDPPPIYSGDMALYAGEQFQKDISEFAQYQAIKTGFSSLDDLTGGLYTGLYFIGAVPGLGKTTFLAQMADNLAKTGQPVIFFSLEQTRAELLSKSLNREIYLDDLNRVMVDGGEMQPCNSLMIRAGRFNAAGYIPEYCKAIGDRLNVYEGGTGTDLEDIRAYIDAFIEKTGRRPVVMVDYLQIIQNKAQRDPRLRVEEIVSGLKNISRECKTPVLAISNINRMNYSQTMDLEAFKETGLIEYTADVIIGLELAVITSPEYMELAAKDKDQTTRRQMIEAAKAAQTRRVILKCLKNRYGTTYSLPFSYIPERDYFQPEETTRPAAITPRTGARLTRLEREGQKLRNAYQAACEFEETPTVARMATEADVTPGTILKWMRDTGIYKAEKDGKTIENGEKYKNITVTPIIVPPEE